MKASQSLVMSGFVKICLFEMAIYLAPVHNQCFISWEIRALIHEDWFFSYFKVISVSTKNCLPFNPHGVCIYREVHTAAKPPALYKLPATAM